MHLEHATLHFIGANLFTPEYSGTVRNKHKNRWSWKWG